MKLLVSILSTVVSRFSNLFKGMDKIHVEVYDQVTSLDVSRLDRCTFPFREISPKTVSSVNVKFQFHVK